MKNDSSEILFTEILLRREPAVSAKIPFLTETVAYKNYFKTESLKNQNETSLKRPGTYVVASGITQI